MSGEYRATDKDWELVEGWAPDDTDVRCLLELRSRVEALEKVIRAITGSLTPAEQAEIGVVSVKDLQADLRSIAFEAMKAAQEANPATEADNATAATVAEIRSLLFKDAAQPAPAVKESLTAAPAGSLVERVAKTMGPQTQAAQEAGELPYSTALAAIREVADWFRNQRDSPETAAVLEQEASR
jgi:hypothetical protein